MAGASPPSRPVAPLALASDASVGQAALDAQAGNPVADLQHAGCRDEIRISILLALPGGKGGWGKRAHIIFLEYPGGTWAESGELLPQDIVNLPPSMIADLNSDGVGDAYWDPNFVISRMDNNNRTDNPLYARHWSWGESIYWLCREGQGQIGWPR